MRPGTRISIGLLLDEQAGKNPERCSFLWEDRAYTQAQVKHRIDSVVRGLISLGVRQGEHVGVLMGPRPSALAVVAALNRLGAVAVLLRPDGPIAREAELGQVNRIIADPENAETAIGHRRPVTFLLGGGAAQRELEAGLTDMERIDPDEVELPAWYRPNPGRAGDLAFILFTGEGERTRANRITNRRWALSAFGTASSAALTDADTVYSVTPLYHPSGLLMSIGGAIAGGARLAMAGASIPDLLGRGPPLRRDRRLLHVDAAARPRRGAAATRRARAPGAPVHRLGHAARAVAPHRGALRPGARARVLRLDRGRGDPRQPHRR